MRIWHIGPHSGAESPSQRGFWGMTAGATLVAEAGRDFIRDIIQADLDSKRHTGVVTRFPPEPNGYLHIGHAKSICLNFGVAQEFGGRCHLRFDDTTPIKEEQEYIDAIKADVHWLGFDWGEHLYHASDYFETLYGWAEHLIRAGLAYVDDQSPDEMRSARLPTNSTCSAACGPADSRTGRGCCAQRSTWHPATSICATRCSIAFSMRAIRAPAR